MKTTGRREFLEAVRTGSQPRSIMKEQLRRDSHELHKSHELAGRMIGLSCAAHGDPGGLRGLDRVGPSNAALCGRRTREARVIAASPKRRVMSSMAVASR